MASGVGGQPGNPEGHREDLLDRADELRRKCEHTAAKRAVTERSHPARLWHCLVGGEQGFVHARGHGAGDEEHVRVAG